MADIQEVMRKRIQAMNDVFGIEPEQIRAGLTPLDVISAGGRTIDAFTGAPTRAAIGAALTGENPITAANKQFGANPELAPSYGPIEDFVLDPGLMLGAVNPAKLGTRLAALNEIGAIGDIEKVKLKKLKQLQSLINLNSGKVEEILAMTEQYGEKLPPYFKHKNIPVPVPNVFSEKGASVIGSPEPTWWNDPFKWSDTKYEIGKDLLRSADKPVTINTASDLIAHDDYLKLIPEGSTVNIYANPLGSKPTTFNPKSPGFEMFPSNKRLKAAVDKLREAGINANLVARSPEASNKTLQAADAVIQRKATNLLKKTENPDFEKRLTALINSLEGKVDNVSGGPLTREQIAEEFQKRGLMLIK